MTDNGPGRPGGGARPQPASVPTRQPVRSPGRRPAGAPGIGSIFVLAYLVILVPGLVVYAVLRWLGLPIGPAGLLGLLVVFLGLGLYPSVLRRLGWVRRQRRQRRRGAAPPGAAPPGGAQAGGPPGRATSGGANKSPAALSRAETEERERDDLE